MSEERFNRIETKLDGIVADVSQLKAGQAALVGDVSQLVGAVSNLQVGQAQAERRLDKLEIVQEEMRDNIKLIAESHGAIQIQLEKGFQGLHEALDRRLVPLEIAMRNRG
jgi:outer membrane murein-binding lipoprotein Lpp